MAMKEIDCKMCDGKMRRKRLATHNQGAALLLVLIALPLFAFNWMIAGVVLLIGLIMGGGSKNYWVCKKCRTKVECA